MDNLYSYNNITYNIEIKRKKGCRSIYFRLSPNSNVVRVSAPYYVSNEKIIESTIKRIPLLVDNAKKMGEMDDLESHYFLGEKKDDVVDLSILKDECLDILNKKVSYYSTLMGVSRNYKVKIRDMKTRLGTNSRRTYSLDFAYILFRFPLEVMDSIIIHELAHHFEFNHSKKFYDVVYKYMDEPTYKYYLYLIRKRKYDRSYLLERK